MKSEIRKSNLRRRAWQPTLAHSPCVYRCFVSSKPGAGRLTFVEGNIVQSSGASFDVAQRSAAAHRAFVAPNQ
jgi:hypothetical protein